MELVLDVREKAEVHDAFSSAGIPFVTEAMDVGDIAVRDADSKAYRVILERKTCKDLAASINDGRYKEQKMRLMTATCPCKGYLIEGSFPEDGIVFPMANGRRTRCVAKTTYYSVLVGTTVRDGMQVFQTESLKHTVTFIAQLLKKLPSYSLPHQTAVTDDYQEALVNTVKTKKKENLTPAVCYTAQLAQVPGMSYSMAVAVQRMYPTMRTLVTTATEEELKALQVTEKRKLGPVLAKRLLEYICQ